MSLHTDLLAQAGMLLRHEPRRPRQASLRRAASTAYYALFHLLIDDASRLLISGSSRAPLRRLVARAFSHSTMKDACRSFTASRLPPAVAAIVAAPIPQDLFIVADTFIDLQEARHIADYDLAYRFSRRDVAALISQAESAFAAWRRVRSDATAKVFLASLLLWREWRR